MDPERFLAPAARTALGYPAPGSWFPPLPPGTIPFQAGYPGPELVPVAELQAAARELLRREADAPLHYWGSPAMAALPGQLRQRMAARGMPVAEPELLVTAGSCQAIDLAARALLAPGEPVAVESPTYMEALEIFRNYTPEILGYPVGPEGLEVDALARDLARRRAAGLPLPRLFYTIPSFQNPTGTTLPLERRRRLLELAAEYDFLILEDDAYGELAFDLGAAPPPLKALDREGRVIYLGSLSKIVAPGLRIGWAAGPARIIQALAVFKKDLDHPFAWALVSTYLEQTDLPARLEGLRERYRQRRDHLLAALAAEMPPGVTWTVPEGGYFVWITLPEGLDTHQLLPAALAAGVAYLPGRYFYFGSQEEQGRRHLRLSFSYLAPEAMAQGVAALARVVRTAG